MTTITDSLGQWEQLGEILVSPDWQMFDSPIINCETFRVTTTVVSIEDWNKNKLKSAGYLQFYYSTGDSSPKEYLLVTDKPVIKTFSVPQDLKNKGEVVRYAGCTMSSRYKNRYSLDSFARWKLKLEVLLK